MEDEPVEQPKRKAGRPKKTPKPAFKGFTPEMICGAYFRMPLIWMTVSADIDNLAELKVVQYVVRHTWGYINEETKLPEYGVAKKFTVDEFVNGRKHVDGSRMDYGTGLSDKAVKEGLARGLEHGLLTCIIDDRDKARVKKYYMLKMLGDEDYIKIFDENQGGITIPSEGNINPPGEELKTPRSKNKRKELTNSTNMNIRNAHPSKNYSSIRSNPAPSFLQGMIEDFSRDFGDDEHTRSNITRACKLFTDSQLDPDAFVDALYQARDTARLASVKKTNSRGRPNRMPYFFSCLEKSLTAQ